MNFCGSCGNAVTVEAARFCTSCGASLPDQAQDSQPAPAAAATPPPAGAAAPPAPAAAPVPNVIGGPGSGGSFVKHIQEAWPLPDTQVVVAGRQLPLDLGVVAAVNVVGSLILLATMWDLFKSAPTMLGNLFASDPFSYLFAYLFTVAIIGALYVAVSPLAVGYFLFRADPVGRQLQVLILGLLLLMLAFAHAGDTGWFWLVVLLVTACVAVLYLSPGASRALKESARARGVPGPIVTARFLSAVVFSLVAVGVLVMLPGLRFLSDLGARLPIQLVGYALALLLAWPGYSALGRGPSAAARTQLTTASIIVAIVAIVGSTGDYGSWQSALPSFVACAAICALLWVPTSSREWIQPGSTTRTGATGPATGTA